MFFVVFKLGFGDNNIQRFKHLFNFKNRREKIFVNVEQAKGHYTFVDKHENFEALNTFSGLSMETGVALENTEEITY